MSDPSAFDPELRDRIGRHVPSTEMPAPTGLTDALTRGRTRRRRRQVAAVVTVAAAAAAVPVGAVLTAGALDRGHRQVQPANAIRLLGTFSTTVRAPAPAVVRGHWTLTFHGNDTVTVDAPTGYRGVVSGVAYSADETTLRTNLFIQDRCAGRPVGRYTWTRDVNSLTLTTVEDTCAVRRAVLTAGGWRAGR